MKKKTVVLLSLSIVLLFSAHAFAIPVNFSGLEWNFTTDTNGSYDVGPDGISITIMGGNNESWDAGYTDLAISAPKSVDATIHFDWSYQTFDTDGPAYDPFGYFVDNEFSPLTADWGSATQNGSTSFSVTAGQIYGFRVFTVDNVYGSATATISNFSNSDTQNPAPVPEPGTMILLSTGLMSVAGLMRRSRKRGKK